MKNHYISLAKYKFAIPLIVSAMLACACKKSECVSEKTATANLREGFENPPRNTRPGVYWYWLNDNITTEGALKDLQAMKEVGIGTVFIGNIGNQEGEFGKVQFNSDAWWDAVIASIKKANELDLDLGIFNSPGWSQSGGPWIKPERAMRYLAISEAKVKGGKTVEIKIPAPDKDFQDVKVIAFKAPSMEGQTLDKLDLKISASPETENVKILADGKTNAALPLPKALTINFASTKDFTARSISLYAGGYTEAQAELFAKIDGKFVSVKKFPFLRPHHKKLVKIVGFIPYAPVTFNFKAVTAKEFRLVLDNVKEGSLAEVEISAYPKTESFSEKTLAKMHPNPAPTWASYMWPAQPELDDPSQAVKSGEVLDISEFADSDGNLKWNAPEGEWIIQRTGMLPTGTTNNPASNTAKGLEADKMSREHIKFHFDSYLGQILRRVPANERKTFKYCVQDSYETGSLNWTDGFEQDFQSRYGYSPVKFIPALYGRVVDSPEITDRFLWDLRRLVADKVSYDYVGGMREVANKAGLKTWLENYGHWGFPGEFLQYGGQSDFVAGEFWAEGLGTLETRAASSCAHTYGKSPVWCESYTAGGRDFRRSPASLKRRGDMAYAEGITQTLLHVYMHQPYEDKTPGMNAWFSTEFNRKNTWFFKMKPFVQYLRRNMFMLQQGLNVADIAYFVGEDSPKMTGILLPDPDGFQFDYINAEIIINKLSVKDGLLVLPHGTTYKMLVLPPQKTMRPQLLEKIKQLVEDGALVLGPKPVRSPSLQDYPKQDAQVKALADELWGDVDGKAKKFRRFGKGIIASSMQTREALGLIGVRPDFSPEGANLVYAHRDLGDKQIYFISNQDPQDVTATPKFRVKNLQPELWDSLTGAIRPLNAFRQDGEYTSVPLKFAPYGSVFIVFEKPAAPKSFDIADNFPEEKTIANIASNWKVDFLEKKFGPEETQNFPSLTDWKDSENEKIKFYSGSAVYKNEFKIPSTDKFSKIYIDFGKVADIGLVKINGKDAGGVWTPPYKLDITKLVKSGTNTVEIEVTNTWVNRLVGDKFLPENERSTWLLVEKFNKKTPLMPSGLLGPVCVSGQK